MNKFFVVWSQHLLILLFVTCLTAKYMTNDMKNKMKDGIPAPAFWPWIYYNVGIFLKSPSIQICSGVLFTKRAVLSTALCYVGKKPEDITILAGTVDLNQGGTNYNVIKIVPRYQGINALAILFAEINVEPPKVHYVQLPNKDDPNNGGTESYFFGWINDIVSTFLIKNYLFFCNTFKYLTIVESK